ncbi:MAG: HRDC domain-containing protein [Planctomycetota bacterium]
MRIKLTTLRYSPSLGGFDDTPLVEFTRDKELLSFHEHFFTVNDVAHLACVITYQDPAIARETLEAAREIRAEHSSRPGRQEAPGRRQGYSDPTSGLGETERVLFQTLREWRAKKARDEGVPPYVILTNRELLQLILKRPESVTALSHLDGIGPAKVRRYGQEILAQLHGREKTAPCAAHPENRRETRPASQGEEPQQTADVEP